MKQSTMQIEGKQLFENGYGISVISENNLGGEPSYEVAVLTHKDGKFVRLTYDSGITQDVVRYCTVLAVESLIDLVRQLPPK